MVFAWESGAATELYHLPAGHEKQQGLGTENTHFPKCKPENLCAFLKDTLQRGSERFLFIICCGMYW